MRTLMKRAVLASSICLISTIIGACIPQRDLDEIKTSQKDIISRLDKLTARPPQGQPPQQQRGPDQNKVYGYPVGKSPSKGPKDAWVTIVEISDFQCPFCARAHQTMKQLEKEFGNDVRLVFKHNPLPFHNRALPAAIATECAGEQGKFWQLHDKLFDNQNSLEETNIEAYAKEVKLDMARFKKCYSEQAPKSRIQEDQALAVKMGAQGTPAFFINGRFVSGAQPFENFKQIVEQELSKAKASGIAKAKYYNEAVETKGEKSL